MELNREDVIEAMKCCSKGTATACYDCPYHKDADSYKSYEGIVKCMEKMMRDALTVVEELTEESQKWEQAYDCSDSACRELSSKCDELTEENERLRAAIGADISVVRVSRGSGKTNHLREVCRIKMDAVRADTLGGIQTRLAMHFGTYTDNDTIKVSDVFRLLDRFTTEMLEASK